MERGLDQRQMGDWQAFYEATPWGEERADRRSAIATALIVNKLRWGGQGVRAKDLLMYQPEESAEARLKLEKAKRKAFVAGTEAAEAVKTRKNKGK